MEEFERFSSVLGTRIKMAAAVAKAPEKNKSPWKSTGTARFFVSQRQRGKARPFPKTFNAKGFANFPWQGMCRKPAKLFLRKRESSLKTTTNKDPKPRSRIAPKLLHAGNLYAKPDMLGGWGHHRAPTSDLETSRTKERANKSSCARS